MNLERLKRLGAAREEAKAAFDAAHQATLDAVLEELADDTGNASAAAKAAGIARATVYNELARRQTTRDELEGAGGPPPPAPADPDPDTAVAELNLTPAQRMVLEALASAPDPKAVALAVGQRTLDGLVRKGLIKSAATRELTRAGRLEAGR